MFGALWFHFPMGAAYVSPYIGFVPSKKKIEISKSLYFFARTNRGERVKSMIGRPNWHVWCHIQQDKIVVLRSRPIKIGVVGFGQFGQFIACTFSQHGKVIVTSRSDYTDISNDMGVKYTSLSDPASFLDEVLDVSLFTVSILSFEKTIRYFDPHIESYISKSRQTLRGQ